MTGKLSDGEIGEKIRVRDREELQVVMTRSIKGRPM
jgi:hypothetical protein